jgi:hypothetical protein
MEGKVGKTEDIGAVLERLDGKEIEVTLRDEKFEMMKVRCKIYNSAEESPKAAKLWLREWTGNRLPKPFAVEILEIYPV